MQLLSSKTIISKSQVLSGNSKSCGEHCRSVPIISAFFTCSVVLSVGIVSRDRHLIRRLCRFSAGLINSRLSIYHSNSPKKSTHGEKTAVSHEKRWSDESEIDRRTTHRSSKSDSWFKAGKTGNTEAIRWLPLMITDQKTIPWWPWLDCVETFRYRCCHFVLRRVVLTFKTDATKKGKQPFWDD